MSAVAPALDSIILAPTLFLSSEQTWYQQQVNERNSFSQVKFWNLIICSRKMAFTQIFQVLHYFHLDICVGVHTRKGFVANFSVELGVNPTGWTAGTHSRGRSRHQGEPAPETKVSKVKKLSGLRPQQSSRNANDALWPETYAKCRFDATWPQTKNPLNDDHYQMLKMLRPISSAEVP